MPDIRNVLLGVTGSVASIKTPIIVGLLKDHIPDVKIRVVVTAHATHFFSIDQLRQDHPDVEVFMDSDEWTSWTRMSDDVLHIELRKWAQVMVIAPLDANTLAKMSNGLCDNLLTCVIRAWPVGADHSKDDEKKEETSQSPLTTQSCLAGSKPLIFAPAMNTYMWDHPITTSQITRLLDEPFNFKMVPPVVKKLACGDYGMGGMAAPLDIVQSVVKVLIPNKEL